MTPATLTTLDVALAGLALATVVSALVVALIGFYVASRVLR